MKCARRFEKWRLLLFYYFILLFLSTQALRQINLKVKMARSGSLLWDLGFAQIDLDLSPGAPPAPVRLPGQKKFLKKNFSPFSGLDGGSWQQTVEVGNIFIGA